ncbi:NADH-ubiquinone oxidoreductase-F iron-sulfur binding region domain-containing protein [Saccharicrinis sp. FJH62]|uniref:NADH-ubiquinone oxidoreductase-F iron-sulfur binding region domain-containing protein n=1 Tax=Saccharicrinis sp. FJH62 TaxID=3344657 RepID=UPI0035D3E87D
MQNTKVIVGLGSCGVAAGASKVYSKLQQLKEAEKLDFELAKTSCVGMCYKEPLVEVIDASGHHLYGEITEEKVAELIDKHIINNEPVKEYIVKSDLYNTAEEYFLNHQTKLVTKRCGVIDPENIEEYEQNSGYKGIKKILEEGQTSEQVIQEVLDSGIRGRGGGGFPTGLKWRFALNYQSEQKYIICNADEGDPGAFMDRSILEGDPHSVLEGMIIGGFSIKAKSGVIYCRAEYPLAIKRLNIAIEQARSKGYLGKNIFGVEGLDFDIYVKEGAGAFVCGEETALIASIEGERGMPRKRPPFPAEAGLWKKPTNINNVETWANIPGIILNGAAEYAKYGTEKSKGTKVFALTGKINNGGLVEVPMGITINDIIYKLGGGIQDGKKFKAVQLGGPSGGCIPAYLGDTIVDYDSVNKTGAIMGSGGMVIMDETTCMVDMARFFLDFTVKESCGKCTFCRMGTRRMLEILTRITEGNGEEGDIEKLEELAVQIKENSLCGLGQTAPNPVLTTIKYFRDEYEAHIVEKKCPALNCKQLLTYTVIEDNCTGCTLCARNCPTDAIEGEKKGMHYIIQDKCIQCGMCYSKCKFDAIKLS